MPWKHSLNKHFKTYLLPNLERFYLFSRSIDGVWSEKGIIPSICGSMQLLQKSILNLLAVAELLTVRSKDVSVQI